MNPIPHEVPCVVQGLTEMPCLYSAPASVSAIALRGENVEPLALGEVEDFRGWD